MPTPSHDGASDNESGGHDREHNAFSNSFQRRNCAILESDLTLDVRFASALWCDVVHCLFSFVDDWGGERMVFALPPVYLF